MADWKRWRAWLRAIHRDVGYLAVGFTIIYAISGIAMNHVDDWNYNYNARERTIQIAPVPDEVTDEAAAKLVADAAGKGIADAIDPVTEDTYWRDNYSSRPYATGSSYEEYRPAYGYGVDAYTRYPDRTFDEIEPELARDWSNKRGSSSLEWNSAKHATRDAWQRVSDTVERAVPGDSDRDGKSSGQGGVRLVCARPRSHLVWPEHATRSWVGQHATQSGSGQLVQGTPFLSSWMGLW